MYLDKHVVCQFRINLLSYFDSFSHGAGEGKWNMAILYAYASLREMQYFWEKFPNILIRETYSSNVLPLYYLQVNKSRCTLIHYLL